MIDLLISVKQVADILDVSESTVRRLEQDGELKTYSDKTYRFGLADVMHYGNCTTQMFSIELNKETVLKALDSFDDEDELTITFDDKRKFQLVTMQSENALECWSQEAR